LSSTFLSYWKPGTVREILRVIDETGDDSMVHSASNQYEKVHPGDTVWIATVWKGGYLALLGRIVVGVCTSQSEAERLLKSEDLWPALYHIIAKEGSEVPLRQVDISDLAPRLRFLSTNDRLDVSEGRVNAQQLQSLRELAPGSAASLEERWVQDLMIPPEVTRQIGHSAAGFGDPETNRQVEAAAVGLVRRHLEEQGWTVQSANRV
jgi:hypothetical protein